MNDYILCVTDVFLLSLLVASPTAREPVLKPSLQMCWFFSVDLNPIIQIIRIPYKNSLVSAQLCLFLMDA